MSETTTPQRPKNGALIRRFLPYMVKYRGVLAFDLFCAALTTLCDIALPTIMRNLTNTVSAAALTVDAVLKMAALYFVLRVIDGAASYFMFYNMISVKLYIITYANLDSCRFYQYYHHFQNLHCL